MTVQENPTVDGVRKGDQLLAWLCDKCGRAVREPGFLGRSWCPHCEDYPYTIEVAR